MKLLDSNKIIEIGKHKICTQEDLQYFLPLYPMILGDEDIITIAWTRGNRFINSEVEYFVKGLHLIENKYKLETHNAFGFGSTSPSYKIISFLKRTNETLASELEKWISLNGGNYYIKAYLSDKTIDNSKNQSSLFSKLEE
jgi:hypothetical protein